MLALIRLEDIGVECVLIRDEGVLIIELSFSIKLDLLADDEFREGGSDVTGVATENQGRKKLMEK